VVETALAREGGNKLKAAARLRISTRSIQRYVATGRERAANQMSEHDLDGAVTSCSAKGVRLQASARKRARRGSRKESEKEAGNMLIWGLWLWLWRKPVA